MKLGDLVQLTADLVGRESQDQVEAVGIIIRPPKRGRDYIGWTYGGQWWWVMWGDGDHTMESEKDMVLVS